MVAVSVGSFAQDAAQEKVAAIKQSLQKSAAALRSYEWIETTTVKIKGEEKSKQENRCYYGADGKQEKVPVEGQAQEPEKKKRGIRGRVVEKKTGEMEDYVKQALALVKEYLPPDPQKLEASKQSGAQKVEVLDNASKLRATFPNYLKQGDALSIDVDPNANSIEAISVLTYLENDPKDAVKLNVTFGKLEDGTSYPSKVVLIGESKNLEVDIDNSGYRKTGS